MGDYVDVSLDTIAGGVAGERFQDALSEILENCIDPNTEHSAAREIILKFRFVPAKEDRGKIACVLDCKTKLASPNQVATLMWAGREGVKIKAVEQDITQAELPFNENQKPQIVKITEAEND